MNEDGGAVALRGAVLVSILAPVHNEAATVRQVIERLQTLPFANEVILVDDGSHDGTRSAIGDPESHGLKILRHDRNLGKGAAIRTALGAAKGEIIVVQDADLEYDPGQIEHLIEPLLQGEADVCYGTRFGAGSESSLPRIRRWANWLLTRCSNLCTGLTLTDMETCYKAMRREDLEAIGLRENRFGFEPEVTAKLARRGLRFTEVPIRYVARSYADGKKIGFRDALRTIWCIVRYSFFD
ncbi:MAG: glycosyltransferase family 2 protein [Pirellulales bacterium]|nr:glycosyltransferase family 2 protein [Pirellulales bacterium]